MDQTTNIGRSSGAGGMIEPKFTPGRDPIHGYQTRDGRPGRVLCTDAAGAYPIRGLVPNGDEDSSTSWDAETYCGQGCVAITELEVPEPGTGLS